jgi:hypothetical protein
MFSFAWGRVCKMRRKVIFFTIVVALFCIIGYSLLYNGFSGVKSLTIQEYDKPLEDGKKTTDKEVIDIIVGILNRSNKVTNTHYKLAVEPIYKIQIDYKDKNKKEVLYFIEGFDKNQTLISSDINSNYYKINKKQTKKIFNLLLN